MTGIMDIYTRLLNGETINKFEAASGMVSTRKAYSVTLMTFGINFSQKLIEDGQGKAVGI